MGKKSFEGQQNVEIFAFLLTWWRSSFMWCWYLNVRPLFNEWISLPDKLIFNLLGWIDKLKFKKNIPISDQGPPHLDLAGVPPSGPGRGTPPPYLDLAGLPPGKGTWDQSLRYPSKGHGTIVRGIEMGFPLEKTWDQSKYYGMEMGYPWVWTDKQTETITFPHPSAAGSNNYYAKVQEIKI